MRRTLLSLPMLGIVVFLVADGLYSSLSNFYPEQGRSLGLILVAWGALLALLLFRSWIRPSRVLLRVMACVAILPISLILLGQLWSGVRYGWEAATISITTSLVVFAAIVIAYLCVAKFAAGPTQANYSSKPTC